MSKAQEDKTGKAHEKQRVEGKDKRKAKKEKGKDLGKEENWKIPSCGTIFSAHRKMDHKNFKNK